MSVGDPLFPWVIGECRFAIRRQKLRQFTSLLRCEAGANADVMKRAGVVEESQQERADCIAMAFLVPSKTCDDAVAIALMFYFKHHALIRLINAGKRLRNDTVEACAFKASKPISCDGRIGR